MCETVGVGCRVWELERDRDAFVALLGSSDGVLADERVVYHTL